MDKAYFPYHGEKTLDSHRQTVDSSLPRRAALTALLIWSLLVGCSLTWNLVLENRHLQDMLVDKAQTYIRKDLAFRRWATRHGGFYVPADDRTQPNPYLAHVPNRDITTPSGTQLTLMNPAYMMRQLNEESADEVFWGHITSLKLMRPENAPDDWERTALLTLQKGRAEVIQFCKIDNVPWLRMMLPLYVKEGCLKCHGFQGYEVGDVRGGISASVSMAPYLTMVARMRKFLILSHGIALFLGIGGIGFFYHRANGRVRERLRLEDARQRSETALRNSEKNLKEAQRVAHIGNWHLDLTGNVLTWSDEIFRIFEKDPGKFGASYEAFLDMVHPEDRESVNLAYTGSVKNRVPYGITYRLLMHDGRIKYVREQCETFYDDCGKPLNSFGTVQDITDLKEAEEELCRINRIQKMVSRCTQALVRSSSERELLETISRHLVDTGGYPLILTCIPKTDNVGFELTVYPEKGAAHFAGELGEWCGTAAYLSGICLQPEEDRRLSFPAEDYAECGHCLELFERFGIRSGFSFVLGVREDHLGGMVLFSSAESFNDEEVKLVKELADDLAFGIKTLRNEEAHRLAQKTLRLHSRAIEASVNGIMIIEARYPELSIVYVNNAFEEITGYPANEALGRDILLLAGKGRDRETMLDIRTVLWADNSVTTMMQNHRKDGSLFWNNLSLSPVHNEEGDLTHFIGIINDVTDQKQYEAELGRCSNFDTLTGLANRNLLNDRMAQALASARRKGAKVALLMLDLDRFKFVNDSLGHGMGDELLKKVSERLQGCVRSQDTLARLGGDEFVLLVQYAQDREELVEVAERIYASLATPFQISDRQLLLTTSIGISIFPDDVEDSDSLLRNADIAMYHAKKKGPGSYHFFTPSMDVQVKEIMDMEADLHRALARGEFLLHFQPKIDVANGRIVGSEALVRWEHPDRGMVSPGAFIPLAEETGLIVPLGTWVLQEACRVNRTLQEEGLTPLPVSVNVSSRQFHSENLVEIVAETLMESGLEARWLELELTESMLMDRPEQAVCIMRELKQLGLFLSLDDFGTGFSSLNYLRRFPVDYLKIDRSFIIDVAVDPGCASVANSIINIAHILGIKAVAEGPETEEQLDFLRKSGCDFYQGFFFSPPLSAPEFAGLLRESAQHTSSY